MVDREKAIEHVQTHGNAIERARLAAILWQQPPPEEALQALAAMQQADGGFARRAGQTSSVSGTVRVLFWLDDLRTYRGPLAEPACRFLLARQHDDGGWDEAGTVGAPGEPAWLASSRIEARARLTAWCAHVLIRFGYAEADGTRCPAGFLLAHGDEAGRLAGGLRSTWMALPMLALYPGPDSEPFRRALAVVASGYSPERRGSHLAWLLRCLQDAGLPSAQPLVARCLADLERAQRADGSWAPEGGAGHAVDATLGALRALKGYGRL